MTDNPDNCGSVNSGNDFLWGVKQIAAELNRTPRQTVHLLENGRIKCARKVHDGPKAGWVCARAALRAEFGARP